MFFYTSAQRDSNNRILSNSRNFSEQVRQQQQGRQQSREANHSGEAKNSRALGTLETPVDDENSTAIRKPPTAETLAIAGNPEKKQQQKEYINSRHESSIRDSWKSMVPQQQQGCQNQYCM
jgi:hypothetical protein